MENKKTTQQKQLQESEKKAGFAFEKQNYMLMIAGVVLLALGYILMIGGGSDDPNVFSYDLFSFRRITLAPILILLGFVVEIFAIMWNPAKKQEK
ncbi:MAG: hypothetical protein PWP35_37 [Bacteroidales bacterium]|jgi:hypothetical protein|nr:hypothetical protein [Bacteroidales bacterium]